MTRTAPSIAICLGLLAVMASGPFLLPVHSQPIPSFWGEWWAGALGLAAAVAGLLAVRNRPLALPPTLVIPAVLLLTLLLQFMAGRLVFPQIGLLYAAYLLWAGLLLILGRQLADAIGLARLADVLAAGFVLGALASAGIAAAQWSGAAAGVPWIFPRLGGASYANLGQTNHYAHYSWLGVASAFYLRSRGWLSRPALWLLALPMIFGSTLCGSRSVLFYPLVVLAAVAWTRRREAGGPVAALMTDAVLLLPVVLALNFLVAWLPQQAAITPVSRLYDLVSGPSVRMAVARAAWSAFLDHPWLGQGAGNYPWASFLAATGQAADAPMMVAENAHNFILHGMAEFGAPATGAVLLLLIFWARQFLARTWAPEQFWCGAVLGIGAVHALLEYPLWYAYFLGPAALLLGATDSGKAITLSGRRTAVYLILLAWGGASILADMRTDYIAIEAASYRPLAAHSDRERAWRISMERLTALQRESLLSPWALLAIAEIAEPSRLLARDRATLCELGIRFSPARSLTTRCAMQMAIAGRDADAQTLARQVLRAYPAYRTVAAAELEKGARTYPEIQQLWQSSR